MPPWKMFVYLSLMPLKGSIISQYSHQPWNNDWPFDLAGVFVIGPGEQGILYEHRESEFGDHANKSAILEAIQQIQHTKKD